MPVTLSLDLKKLHQQIDQSEAVSFDVFDTAVLRKVFKPNDIFAVLRQKMKMDFDFESIRVEAEGNARKEQRSRGGAEEITLDEIYDQVKKITLPGFSKQKIDEIKKMEAKVELEFSTCNPFIFQLYQYAKTKKKKIIFASDMYLPPETIQKMLEKSGYKKFDSLYVSSELGVTKDSGRMFDAILENLKINPDRILHIGDNPIKDVAHAERRGIKTFYYQQPGERALENKEFKIFYQSFTDKELKDPLVSCWLALIVNRYFSLRPDEMDGFYEKLGFWYFGFVMLGFAHWIGQNARKEKVKKIYFLSRDGFLIHGIYEKIKRKFNFGIPSDYLVAPRKSFILSSFSKMNDKKIDYLFELGGTLTIGGVFDKLGLNTKKYQTQIAAAGFTDEKHPVAEEDRERIKRLVRGIQKDVVQGALSHKKTLRKYLGQKGLFKYRKIALVDVGWNGTLQKLYESIFVKDDRIPQSVVGYYLALNDPKTIREVRGKHLGFDHLDNMKGYLFQFGVPQERYRLIRSWAFWETILTAPHGPVIGLSGGKSKIKPIIKNAISDSSLETTKKIHAGVLHFAAEFIEIPFEFNLELEKILKPVWRLVTRPTFEEASKLGASQLEVSIQTNPELVFMAKPSLTARLMINPIKTLKEFRQTLWKEGYLRQVPLGGFFLSYYKQFNFVNKAIKRVTGLVL